MTQVEKKLVIKDLCGRLPYGVIVQVNDGLGGTYNSQLVQVFCDRVSCSISVRNPLKECICIDSVKPYLRPMSSMTDDEALEFMEMTGAQFIHANLIAVGECKPYDISDIIDWFNEHHFDHRGLINKGLAIEVTEDNNPYVELPNFTNSLEEESDYIYNHAPDNHQITIGTKIRSKANPYVILSIISDDCHGDEFECSNGSVLSLRQIEKYYDIYTEENKI